MKKVLLLLSLPLLLACFPKLKRGIVTTTPSEPAQIVELRALVKIEDASQKAQAEAPGKFLLSLVANTDKPYEALLTLEGVNNQTLSKKQCTEVSFLADGVPISVGVVKNTNEFIPYAVKKEFIASVSSKNILQVSEAKDIKILVCGAAFVLNPSQTSRLGEFVQKSGLSLAPVESTTTVE